MAARTQSERDGGVVASAVVNGRGSNDGRSTGSMVFDGGEDDVEGEDSYVPEGYASVQEYLAYVMKLFDEDYKADEDNIREAMEDLRFTYVDQWDPETRMEREAMGRPCLQINTLPQFVGQVIGDRRMNRTSIKIVPLRGATVEQANARTGLIRTIESMSRAQRTYDMAFEDQTVCGIGNFKIELDYAYNSVFEQDIFIRPIPNPLGVLWDFMSVDPTGRDAGHVFEIDEIPRRVYEKEWPEFPVPDNFGTLDTDAYMIDPASWVDRDTVKIVGFWEMKERPATFAMMQDGQIEDITDMPEIGYMHRVQIDQHGEPMIREGIRRYACRHLVTSFAILEGPYELPITRVPIIRVSGRVGRVGTRQVRFGVVRWARDPSLMRNYWRSTAAETLAMAPKNQWIAPAAAVEGREEDFRQAHLSGDPLLVYNDVGPDRAPQRQDPPNLPAAVLNESNMNAQDIKDVTGIHDASLGIKSNEVSGKAIMARQREGDVANITFHDNLNEAILEGGCVINELMPIAYDTMRTIRLTGVDDSTSMVKVNDPFDEASPDLTSGEYDTIVTTGPSYTTQRMEAAEAMVEAVKVFPQLMEVAGDLIVEAQDWPEAEKIAERLKKVLPAAQDDKKPEDMTAEELQAQAQAQEQAQAQAQLQARMAEAEVVLKEAQAKKEMAEAEKAAAEAKVEALKAERLLEGGTEDDVDPFVADAQRREAEAKAKKAEADARKAEADAEAAEAALKVANDNITFNQLERGHKIVALQAPQTGGEAAPSNKSGAPRRAARPAPKQRKAQ